jgi:hypothetical protein
MSESQRPEHENARFAGPVHQHKPTLMMMMTNAKEGNMHSL